MGFCKRCGDIINTEKCRKCGGLAVSGVVKFNASPEKTTRADRWEKKYTHRRSASPSTLQPLDPNAPINDRYPTTPSPKKRFPRPTSVDVKGGYPRPTSTFRKAVDQPPVPPIATDVIAEEVGPVVPMDDGLTLAKVHGTVLSPPAPLHCAHCNSVFPHNSTLYPLNTSSQQQPDPFVLDPETNPLAGPYACLACFTQHRSLGTCATCHKLVLPLKSEGKWITVREKVWHSRCFACQGCGIDLSKRPMVGISGDPECEDCFGKVVLKREERQASPAEKLREKGKETVSEMKGLFNTAPLTPRKAAREQSEAPTTPGAPPSNLSPSTACAICTDPLLPPPGQTAPLISAAGKQYHASCFVCCFCDKPFVKDEREGTAVFAFVGDKPAHPSCAPPVSTPAPSPKREHLSPSRTPVHMASAKPIVTSPPKVAIPLPVPVSPSKGSHTLVLPRPLSRSPSKSRPSTLFFPAPSPAGAALPRPSSPLKSPTFAAALRCPACSKSVSPMERGTVPGPGGGRWHATCLKCGAEKKVDIDEAGEDELMIDAEVLKGRGCAKKLDTGAKEAGGRVWCRRCWDDLPPTVRPASPTRMMPLSPTHTGMPMPISLSRTPSRNSTIFPRSHGRRESLALTALTPQMTGTGLRINRQLPAFTPTQGLSRQVTGTGYDTSPTKDASLAQLVKQMTGNGNASPTRRPRSVYAPAFGGLGDVMED
ncbi:hypothetical protein CALCODRAFT_514782 [Calocera cornea HHB12733]|uniref:LIM zinc-binding domain-containing protein n=1 Tax=Calocera cornea HHB12733 TaxID=1353952 RepID=A0A165J7Z6_9BASI|nr:hypothetical protein CALCODRAFT_514782 [Calocera cornea HHB12733]